MGAAIDNATTDQSLSAAVMFCRFISSLELNGSFKPRWFHVFTSAGKCCKERLYEFTIK